MTSNILNTYFVLKLFKFLYIETDSCYVYDTHLARGILNNVFSAYQTIRLAAFKYDTKDKVVNKKQEIGNTQFKIYQ